MKKSIFTLLALLWLILLVACAQIEPTTPSPKENTDPIELSSAQVVPYDLGETTLLQDHFPEGSQFRDMPVHLRGVIGVPAGEGHAQLFLSCMAATKSVSAVTSGLARCAKPFI
ncbi:MAG: hypothetical protein P8Y03_01930 [Anaerolineales bacterium]|jgi:hypothetical protein